MSERAPATADQPASTLRAPSGRRADLVACLLLLLATLLVFGDVLFSAGDRVISQAGTDIWSQFAAWREFGFGQLRRGNLCLWNPHLFSGTPYLGGFQSALLYPPNWIYLVLPLPRALNTDVAVHVLLSGIFMYAWARHRGLHPAAALLAGLLFMFGGAHYLHVYAGHLTNLCAMVWAPLIFLSIDQITADNPWSLRGVWLGSGAVAMQILAGHPQYVFYTAVAAALYGALNLYRSPHKLSAGLALVTTCAGGALLSAAQLFTGFNAASEGLRARLTYPVARIFALAPENLLTLILPGLFGDGDPVEYWGRWYFWEQSLFVGVTAVALAVYGAARGDKRLRRFSLTMALATLVLALGYYTPLFHLLYDFVPGFASFRGVSKFAFVFLLFLSMLAAVGYDRVLASRSLPLWPAIAAAAAATVLLVFALLAQSSAHSRSAGVWNQVLRSINWTDEGFGFSSVTRDDLFYAASARHAARQFLWAAFAAAAFAAVWFLARRRPAARYCLLAVAAAELITFAVTYRPTFELDAPDLYGSVPDLLRPLDPRYRVLCGFQSPVLRAGAFDAWGNDPMVLGRYSAFMAASQHRPPDQLIIQPPDTPSPMWRVLRLKYFFEARPPLTGVVNLADPIERAQLVSNWRVIPDADSIFQTLADPTFDPRQTVLLESPIDLTPAATQPAGPASVEITDLSTDAMEIRVRTEVPAVLLITDNYSPSWRAAAYPDSSRRSYTVVPADHTLRGIPLTPGQHHFRLEYRPRAFVIGTWTSLVSLALWAALPFFINRFKRGTNATA